MNPSPAAQSTDDLFRLILEASPSGMLLVDRNGAITLVNGQIEQMFGYQRHELIGQPIEILMTDRHRAHHPGQRQAFYRAPSVRAMGQNRDLHGRRKNGSEFFIEIGLNPIHLPDGLHVLASIIDITERKYAEDALRHAHDNLDRLVQERTAQLSGANAALQQELAERKQAEEALRQSEERFAKVFRLGSYPIGITDVKTGRCLDVNEACLNLFEFTREEVVGQTTLLLGIWPNPEERAQLIRQLLTGKPVRNLDLTFRTKSGLLRHILVSSDLIELNGAQCLLTIGNDITERKQAEAALTSSRNLLQSVLRAAPIRVFWKDLGSRYLGCNQLFAQDAGVPSPESLIGKTDYDLAWKEQADGYRADDLQVMDSGLAKFDIEEPQTSPNGTRIWLKTSKVPLRDDSEHIIGVLGIYDDITRRKQAEADLQQAEERLQQSQKLEAVGRLAGGIAHDFNNLLTGINGNAELLLKQVEPWNPMYQRLDTIRRTGEQAARITRQLLTLGRRQVVQPVPVQLNGLVRKMADLLQPILGENIRLTLALTPSIGLLKADPAQLDQVLLNLAVNARDAMPDGGTLTIETMNVIVQKPAIRLMVRDTGQGMSEEVRTRIFEPFFTTKPFGKGTGLGLATVYGIVTQCEGTIEVESAVGKGTTFSLTFPRIDLELPDNLRPGQDNSATTILLVDDDPIVRELAHEMLTGQGYHVLESADGADALRQAAAREGNIHLLLTDFLMPGMNGRELAEQFAARWPAIPVAFMSGYTDDEVLRQQITNRSLTFISKPFTTGALLSAVGSALSTTGTAIHDSGTEGQCGEKTEAPHL